MVSFHPVSAFVSHRVAQLSDAELWMLLAQNRLKPLTQPELRKVYNIKRNFGAKIGNKAMPKQ
jgi:hypothetical protein